MNEDRWKRELKKENIGFGKSLVGIGVLGEGRKWEKEKIEGSRF